MSHISNARKRIGKWMATWAASGACPDVNAFVRRDDITDLSLADEVGPGCTPMEAAVVKNDYKALRALVVAGASPHAYSARHGSVLCRAVNESKVVAVRTLLDAGAPVQGQPPRPTCVTDADAEADGCIPVTQLRFSRKGVKIFKMLLDGGADPNSISPPPANASITRSAACAITPHSAQRDLPPAEAAEVFRDLFGLWRAAGGDPAANGKRGLPSTLAHYVASANPLDPGCLALLLDAGFDPTAPEPPMDPSMDRRETPSAVAVIAEYTIWLHSPGVWNASGSEECFALAARASGMGYPRLTQGRLDAAEWHAVVAARACLQGADPSRMEETTGVSMEEVAEAVAERPGTLCKLIVEAAPSVASAAIRSAPPATVQGDPMNMTAADHVCDLVSLRDKPELAEFVHWAGSPLLCAIWDGGAALVPELVARGADPNRTPEGSETLAAYAAHHGYTASMKALAEAGADFMKPGASGRTALDYAVTAGGGAARLAARLATARKTP